MGKNRNYGITTQQARAFTARSLEYSFGKKVSSTFLF